MSKKFLIRQIKDRNNKFFSNIRLLRESNLKESRDRYSWSSYNHKLYPSSFRSFYMCPKRFIEEDVHKAPSFTIDQVYKMEIGTALHKMYQSEILHSKTILWNLPNIPENLKKKLDDNWPEVPVFDSESGISGRADVVLNVNNEIVVFDIKTTSVDKDRWESYKLDKLPSQAHLVQVSIYIYLMNKYKYYEKKIKKGALGYVNIAMTPGEENSEFEYYFDYTDEIESMVENLISSLKIHRDAYLKNCKVDCTYKYCGVHNDRTN